jgi:hypothetical protein
LARTPTAFQWHFNTEPRSDKAPCTATSSQCVTSDDQMPGARAILTRLRLGPTRRVHLALVLAPPPPGRGRQKSALCAKRPGGGDSRAAIEVPQVRHRCHPTPDRLRRSDPPPSGEGERRARYTTRMRPSKRDTSVPRVLTQAGLQGHARLAKRRYLD